MSVLDLILNCVGLLLWLSWRSSRLTSAPRVPGVALIGTLKRAESRSAERWPAPMVLVLILFARAVLYWQVGASIHWIPSVSVGPIVLHFRSDLFTRALLFSMISFLVFLATFYFSLLLLAALNSQRVEKNPWNVLIRAHIGVVSPAPPWLMLILPFFVTFLFWLAAEPILGWLKVLVPARSFRHLVEQAALIGVSSWLLWQYAVATLFALHILSSYVYLGNAPFWRFVNAMVANLLRPLAALPLRVGKIDLAPILALLTVLFVAAWMNGRLVSGAPTALSDPLRWLYGKLPV